MGKNIVVVGSGSVGKRHLRNLAKLGCALYAFDPRQDRLDEAASEVLLEGSFLDFSEMMKNVSLYDGCVVASPPSFHVEQCCSFIKAGVPILLEKPVCPTLSDSQKLLRSFQSRQDVVLLLGYTYRWWTPLQKFRELIQSNKVGKLLNANFCMSAHLADWHPWERYQDFFMSSKNLGGGALLDESHFIDLMLWFFGMPASLYSRIEKISSLEIDTDDNVDILASYNNGLRVNIHLDLYGRPHEKYISVTGEEGTLKWSFDPNSVSYSASAEKNNWQEDTFDYERNDMFINVAKEFLNVLDSKDKASELISCNLMDGINVLKVIEACRASSQSGKKIIIEENFVNV